MLIDVISCYGGLYHNEIHSNVICHVLITNLTQCKLIDPWEIWKEFKSVISEHLLQIKLMSNASIIALRWIPQNTFDGKSTLVQVMAWCRQATSQYLNHFFLPPGNKPLPEPMLTQIYVPTRQQLVNYSEFHIWFSQVSHHCSVLQESWSCFVLSCVLFGLRTAWSYPYPSGLWQWLSSVSEATLKNMGKWIIPIH